MIAIEWHKLPHLLGLLVLLSANACVYQKAKLNPKLAEQIRLADQGRVPTAAFFRDPDFHTLKISPDGQYIAAIFPVEGRDMLGILTSDLKQVVHIVRFRGDNEVFWFDWVNHERLVLRAGRTYGYLDGRYGRSQLYFVNVDGSNFRDFFAKEWASFEVLNLMPDDPNHIVVAKYHYFDDGKPVALKINVYNGRKDVLSVPPFAQGRLLANHRGIVRVGIEVDYDESFDRSTIYVKQGGGWNRLAYPTPGKTSIEPVYLDERRQELFVFSARETGKTGLYRVDLQTGESQPVFVHERVDIDELITDRGRIVGLVYEDGSPILAILDQDSVKMQEYKRLQKLFPDELVTELNFTKDYSKAVFQVKSDRNPGDYYLYDVEQKTVRFLAQKRPGIDPKDMGPRLPVAIPARDGLRLDGYVTLPKDQKLKSQLPMIVLPHGGPFYVRDQWSFDPEAHFFASRGYAVLQVNFRGSEGYGIDFARAGHRQWGKAMQDDLTDATHWAIDEGIADPDRVCIFGGSYGGYAALMGVVKEPDLYRCAISYVGVSDLNLMHQVGDANDTAAGLKYLEKTLGPEGGGLARYSPAQHADKIKAPVFIVHGADDQRVPIDHAEVMRDALKKAGTSFELLVKPYEGHGFTQFPNRLEAYHKMLRFIEQSMSQASERHGMAG